MYFEKYEACGNDFIILHEEVNKDYIKKICNRRYGIGADGVMYPSKSNEYDICLNYYNKDGSKAPMCGNGIRCFSKFLIRHNYICKNNFNVETDYGIININCDKNITVKINILNKEIDYPHTLKKVPMFYKHKINLNNIIIEGYIIYLGTLHFITFDKNTKYAEEISSDLFFPSKINVNYVKIINENKIDVNTFERGVGWTLSCGTGSASSGLLCKYLGLINKKISIKTLGGNLDLVIDDNLEFVEIIGSCNLICFGYIEG